MQPGEVLRFAQAADIKTLIKLRIDFLDEDYDGLTPQQKETIAAQLGDYFILHLGRDCFVSLLEIDGRVVSTAMLVLYECPANPSFPTGKTGILYSVYTLPAHRRRGYSTRVVKSLIQKAREQGASYIDLSASKDGKPLYELLGFTEPQSRYTEMRLNLLEKEG